MCPSVIDRLLRRARDVLIGNDRGSFTAVAQNLYPHQWLWDAGFNALGWAVIDESRAWAELQQLVRAQWVNGMIPHIVFHDAATAYRPGAELWAVDHNPPTSGITQPPVLATIVKRLWQTARDHALAEAMVADLVPRLIAHHRWLYRARDRDGTGLVTILHPWESGMDDSPVWDAALRRVTVSASDRGERSDVATIAASQRPPQADYDRYLALVRHLRGVGYEPGDAYPFRVVSVAFNAVLRRADRDLLELTHRLGVRTDEIAGWVAKGDAAFETLWDESAAAYLSRDLVSHAAIPVRTIETLLPLFAGFPDQRRAGLLAAHLASWGRVVRYVVPSAPPSSPSFEPRRLWRGPVWAPVNWMIAEGVAAYGYADLAARAHSDLRALVEGAGFRECFDPLTGEGLGAMGYSWTAAVLLTWSNGPLAPSEGFRASS
jgi:Trehalase